MRCDAAVCTVLEGKGGGGGLLVEMPVKYVKLETGAVGTTLFLSKQLAGGKSINQWMRS